MYSSVNLIQQLTFMRQDSCAKQNNGTGMVVFLKAFNGFTSEKGKLNIFVLHRIRNQPFLKYKKYQIILRRCEN